MLRSMGLQRVRQNIVTEHTTVSYLCNMKLLIIIAWIHYFTGICKTISTSITSDTQMTPLLGESEELKGLLMKAKEESEKVGLKLNIQRMKIMASGPTIAWKNR